MKKQYMFFVLCIFTYSFVLGSVLTKEDWLKNFSEQKIDNQNVILAEIAQVYSLVHFVGEHKEIFKKFIRSVNQLDLTDEEKFVLALFVYSNDRKNLYSEDENIKESVSEFKKIIFKDPNSLEKIFENPDELSSKAQEIKKTFIDAQNIFEQKRKEQQDQN